MSVAVEPFFLEGPRGRLFALYYFTANAPRTTHGDAVLYFPPFAEELNRSRRMAALQARAFATAGHPVLIVDLYGTGDSEGEFGDGTWEGWLADMTAALDWLHAAGASRILFWGLRLGALLAVEMATRTTLCGQLILWAPVARGEVFLNQFLRLRLAADLLHQPEGQSVTSLKEELNAGAKLEIAGYELNPDLAQAIQRRRLQGVDFSACEIDWFDVGTSGRGHPLPVAQAVIDEWSGRGIPVRYRSIAGEPFWTTPEISTVPELIRSTLSVISP